MPVNELRMCRNSHLHPDGVDFSRATFGWGRKRRCEDRGDTASFACPKGTRCCSVSIAVSLIGEIVWVLGVVAWYVIRYPFERRAKRVRVVRDQRSRSEAAGLALSVPWSCDPAGSLRRHRNPGSCRLSGQSVAHRARNDHIRLRAVGFSKVSQGTWPEMVHHIGDPRSSQAGVYRAVRDDPAPNVHVFPSHQPLAKPCCCQTGLWVWQAWSALRSFFSCGWTRKRMMLENFGPQYRAYMERTKRIIPYLY